MWGEAAIAIRKGGREAAIAREDRLWEYWKGMFRGESRMVRHEDDTQESARKILSYLIDHPSATQPLQIQRELVDHQMTLEQTDAGRYVRRELLMAKEKLDRELAELQRAVEDTKRKVNEEALRTGEAQREVQREVIRVNTSDSVRSAKRKRMDEGQQWGDTEYSRRPSLRSGPGSVTGSYWRVEEAQSSGRRHEPGNQQPDEWTRYIPKMFLNWFPGSDSVRSGGTGVMASRWPSIFGSSKPGESSTSLAYGPGS
jgi:hypothetical protein